MSFDPTKHYLLAGYIYSNEAMCENLDEARHRASISRSYYAVMLKARDLASIRSQSGSVHRDVREYYEKRKPLRFSNRLNDLRQLRGKADYNMELALTSRDSGKALKLARQLLTELGENFD